MKKAPASDFKSQNKCLFKVPYPVVSVSGAASVSLSAPAGCVPAALMLAQDFSIPYEDGRNAGKEPIRPRLRKETEEQKFKRMERHCFRVLSDYYHLLRRWKEEYAPRQPDEAWNPRFVEALQNMSRVEYLMDVLLSGDIQERAALITGHGKEVRNLSPQYLTANWTLRTFS